MKSWLAFLSLFLVVGCAVAAFLSRTSRRKPVVRPPPRSRKTALSYEQTNAVASVFLATIELKERGATWPAIFSALNPEDDPHTRTVLLEIRALGAYQPEAVLSEVERVCIESKPDGDRFTRVALLERVKTALASRN